jgi:phosphatidylglycerol---prolipoprotein diacylglyceryl transferase
MYPILFTLPGGKPIFGYGVMLGLSCVIGAHLAVYLAGRTGVRRDQAWRFTIFVIVMGVVGGRVHDLMVNALPQGRFMEELFKLEHAGRTAYGGFLGAIFAAVLARWIWDAPFWRMGDAAAPTLALGLGLTRIGCFLAGCDYGVQSERWGWAFPAHSPAWEDQVQASLISPEAAQSLPVLPVQLLASFTGLALTVVILLVWRRRPDPATGHLAPAREGDAFLTFFLLYGLARSGLEQIRGDVGRGELAGLSTSTTIGLVTAGACLLLLLIPQLRALRPESQRILSPEEADALSAGGAAAQPPEAGHKASPKSS